METIFTALIEGCKEAVKSEDAQVRIRTILERATRDPEMARAISGRTEYASFEDLAIYRSNDLTLLAATLPPGFSAAPHNHNLWSVVGVCSGQEDNEFFERDGDGLKRVGSVSVVGPAVLPNPANVIHAIRNPLAEPLLALHAYGGDLFATPRSTWDAETYEEIPFDWQKVRSEQ